MYNVRSFCETMVLNEALFGQTSEEIKTLTEELGLTVDWELKDISLCLTGISGQKRWGGFPANCLPYRKALHLLIEELLTWGRSRGLFIQYAGIHYDRSGQICFLLKREAQATLELEDFARETALRLEKEYCKMEGYEKASLANFTVLSKPVPNYDHLAETFSQLCRLKELAFFRMETGVFREEDLRGRPVERALLYEKVGEIKKALNAEDEKLFQQVKELFLEYVKESMDLKVCDFAVHELNRAAFQAKELFCPEIGDEWAVLSREDYITVEQLEEAAEERLLTLRKKILSSGNQRRNPLTMRAAKWLAEHYTENVGLQETAAYLGVSSSYLSRTFSRDMGAPLSAYLSGLRLEQAKRLLTTSDIKIAQVAEQSGFRDPEYFRALFQKKTGLYPQKFREKSRESGNEEAE